jgi:hypothetical protein
VLVLAASAVDGAEGEDVAAGEVEVSIEEDSRMVDLLSRWAPFLFSEMPSQLIMVHR